MTQSLIQTRAHLAHQILQLTHFLAQPPLKGARRPSPAALQRTRFQRQRTDLLTQLRASLSSDNTTPPARITRSLLVRLAYHTPYNTITLTQSPPQDPII